LTRKVGKEEGKPGAGSLSGERSQKHGKSKGDRAVCPILEGKEGRRNIYGETKSKRRWARQNPGRGKKRQGKLLK